VKPLGKVQFTPPWNHFFLFSDDKAL
jgi:hypothetical protein